MNKILDQKDPPLYKFIQFLKKEFISLTVDIDKYLCGKSQKHRLPRFEEAHKSIKKVLERRNSLSKMDTLLAIVRVEDSLRL